MKKFAAITCGLLISCGANAGMYKCEENGQTVYSQTPCGDEAEEVKIWDSRVGGGTGATNISDSEFEDMTPSTAASKVSGIVTQAEILARDCEWALKVTKKVENCNRLIRYVKGPKWADAQKLQGYLVKNYPGHDDANTRKSAIMITTVQRVLATINARD